MHKINRPSIPLGTVPSLQRGMCAPLREGRKGSGRKEIPREPRCAGRAWLPLRRASEREWVLSLVAMVGGQSWRDMQIATGPTKRKQPTRLGNDEVKVSSFLVELRHLICAWKEEKRITKEK